VGARRRARRGRGLTCKAARRSCKDSRRTPARIRPDSCTQPRFATSHAPKLGPLFGSTAPNTASEARSSGCCYLKPARLAGLRRQQSCKAILQGVCRP
jgi:hypothetical protein